MYLLFKDRICSDLPDAIDLADTQLVSKYKIKIQSLLFAINVFKKYAGVAPLKKKCITITNAFRTFFDKSRCKSNRIWVDKGSEI